MQRAANKHPQVPKQTAATNKQQRSPQCRSVCVWMWMASGTKWSAKPVWVCCRERRSLSSAMRRCYLHTHSLSLVLCAMGVVACAWLPMALPALSRCVRVCVCACLPAPLPVPLPALSCVRLCVCVLVSAVAWGSQWPRRINSAAGSQGESVLSYASSRAQLTTHSWLSRVCALSARKRKKHNQLQ